MKTLVLDLNETLIHGNTEKILIANEQLTSTFK